MKHADATVDVLAVAAHPDDVELACGGIICKLVDDGYRVGIVDLTRGELGTRGTPEQRAVEAQNASGILGIHARENLGLGDGNIVNTTETRLALIRLIRRYRPEIMLVNAPDDRHPDHPAAARFAVDSRFYAGLRKIETTEQGKAQEPWRPPHLLHYIQALELEPTLVVDVSDVWERRTEALLAYRSQFHATGSLQADEPDTFISTPAFLEWIAARARSLGYRIGATHGEGLIYYHGPIGVDDLVITLRREKPA